MCRWEVIALRSELILHANDVQLCAETFGEPGDPPILLIMGRGASMDWWPDEFCERLAAGSRFVVRYDHRDTGRSVCSPPGEPGYTERDLVNDPVGLLDALGVDRAHLAGFSAGGALAQLVALDHPDRVASLALISTTFADRALSGLPGMSPDLADRLAIPTPDWSSRADVIDYLVEQQRATVSGSAPFDEEDIRGIAGRMFDRSTDIEAAVTNHDLVEQGDPPGRRLEELAVPTVVIHGLDDPLFPVEHGRALAETIPSTELLVLPEVGHELPRRSWGLVVPAILAGSSASARPA